jgi:hypothetical protein
VTDRLAAIGSYTEHIEDGDRYNCWENLPALRGEFPSVRLCFQISSLRGDYEPDDRMFALWERYRPRHAEHATVFRERILAFYRGWTRVYEWDWQNFPPDLPAADVFRMVTAVEIRIWRQEDPEWGVQHLLAAYFDVEWEQQHPSWLSYDEVRDSFGDWM